MSENTVKNRICKECKWFFALPFPSVCRRNNTHPELPQYECRLNPPIFIGQFNILDNPIFVFAFVQPDYFCSRFEPHFNSWKNTEDKNL